MKIREINGERIPTGQQLHRVKIISTKPEDLDGEVLQEDIATFEEILQLTNIFSIKVSAKKNILYNVYCMIGVFRNFRFRLVLFSVHFIL